MRPPRPGANSQGFSANVPGLGGKTLELLREAAPHGSQVSVIWTPGTPAAAEWREAQAAARTLGVQLESFEVARAEDFVAALPRILRRQYPAGARGLVRHRSSERFVEGASRPAFTAAPTSRSAARASRHGGTRVMTTLKRLALLVVILAVLLIPVPASLLETEVRHGESPTWSGPVFGRYAVTVVGYYTDNPNLARAGVRRVEWQTEAKAKRRAEMLALRAAFLDWFVEEWVREDGVREDGVHQILGYPLSLRGLPCGHVQYARLLWCREPSHAR
jgi:hypothetical protein